MEIRLSGAIAFRPTRPSEREGDASEDWIWVCQLCSKTNKVGDDADLDICRCCGRERYARWLELEKHELQLEIGTRLQLPDDVSFGTRVGVVSGIDFLRQRIQTLALSSRATQQSVLIPHMPVKQDTMSASGRRSRLRFEILEHEAALIQDLRPISSESSEQVHTLIEALEQHGICGECSRVFRIAQGDISKRNATRDILSAQEADLRRLHDMKTQNIKLREYDKVLENTKQIKSVSGQITCQKRGMEFLSFISCPHCGWIAR